MSTVPRSRAFAWLLFLLALLLFVGSVHLLISARMAWLWIAAIVFGEWGHFAAIIAVVVAVLALRDGSLGKVTAALALVAALLCLSPAIRAAMMARSLPLRCTEAFGAAQSQYGRRVPFSFADLFRTHRIDGVSLTEPVYASEGSKQLTLDLYQSKTADQPQPIILVVHGGAWARGSKSELPALNRHLAHEAYAVAAINYRHAPKWRSPAAVDDAFAAIVFLKAHAAEFHLDANRIALIGRSAGGQIALSTAYAQREPAIRGVVAFYPPTDLVLGYENPSPRRVLDSKKVLEDYLGGTPAEKPDEYAAASPINFVNAATPPTLLVHGALDSIVWPVHSELLTTRLEQARRPHLYLSLGWATHGCDANLYGPSGQLSLYAIDRFLAAVFTQP